MTNIEHEVDELLQAWGRWAANHGIRIGFPEEAPYRRLAGSAVGQAGIDPETALEVDRAVSELGKIDKQAKEVVEWYYICGTSLSSMPKACNITQPKAKALRRFALSFCMGRLYQHVTV